MNRILAKFQSVRAATRKPASERSMSEKLIISGALNSTSQAISIILRVVATLIVTRLLSPEIFGLFAIITTFQVILFMLTDFGIPSLIKVSDKTEDDDFLRTCWTVQALRGLFLYGLVLLLALGLYGLQQASAVSHDTVYGAPVLPAALAASGFQLIFQGFSSVNQHVYARDMRFFRITMMQIVQAFIMPTLTIMIALYHPSVWAFVIAGLGTAASGFAMSFYLFPGASMRFCLNPGYRRELYVRGRWIMSSSAIFVFSSNADQIVLSLFTSPAFLGVYYIAKQIFMVPKSFADNLIGAVRIQVFKNILPKSQAEFHQKYYRFRRPIDLLIFVFIGGILVSGPTLIDLMYDDRYLEAGTILQILSIGLAPICFLVIHGAFEASKRFKLIAFFTFLQFVTIYTGTITALWLFEDPYYAIFAIALHRVPDTVIMMIMARREGWLRLRFEFLNIPAIALGAAAGYVFNILIGSII